MRPLYPLPLLLLVGFLRRYGAWRVAAYVEMPALALAAAALVRLRRPLLLLALLVAVQEVYFGGAALFPQLLLGGRATVRWWCEPLPNATAQVAVEMLITDVDRAFWHAQAFRAYGLGPVHTVYGSSRVNGTAANFPPAARAMLLHALASGRPWILLLEEDAAPHWDFARQLGCLLAEARADAYWLDARTDFVLKTRGLRLNIAGLLVNRAFALAAAAEMRLDNPKWVRVNALLDPWWHFTTDRMYALLCEPYGAFRCEERPLVSES